MAKKAIAEENYWPGFVDALSTIVMVLTFLLIILIMAIYVLSQAIVDDAVSRAEKGGQAKAAAAQGGGDGKSARTQVIKDTFANAEGPVTDSENKEEGYDGPTEIREATNDDAKIFEVDVKNSAKQKKKASGPTKLTRSKEVIVLNFSKDALSLTPETQSQTVSYIQKNKALFSKGKISIYSYASLNAVSLSTEKRNAYYRLMSTRNAIIKAGIAPERIQVRVMETDDKSVEGQVKIFKRIAKE